jgi:hypothetical protein
MDTATKQKMLQVILTECGVDGWYVIEPSVTNPTTCLLLNPKEKKIAEIGIPDNLLKEGSRQSNVGELLRAAIENASSVIPHAGLSSASLPRR